MVNTCRNCSRPLYGAKRSACFDCVPSSRAFSVPEILSRHSSGFTVRSISQEFKISWGTVRDIVSIYGEPSLRYNRLLSTQSRVSLDKEWLDGWLLGDGSLETLLSGSCRFQFTVKYREYAEYVVQFWEKMGLTHGPIHHTHPKNEDGEPYDAYHVASHVHSELLEVARRWYPEGKKIIPLDLKITPVVLREWFLGDGSFSNGVSPRLYMGGISEEEVNFLYGLLKNIFGPILTVGEHASGFRRAHGKKYKVRWMVNFTSRLIGSFFSYIGPCTLPCYAYKWPGPLSVLSKE